MIVSGLGEQSLADLQQVLAELVDAARTALGRNFCGAYLVGSFALEAGDEHSDVDFLVVTDDDLDAEQLRAIRLLHARLPDYSTSTAATAWARHLEGSYVPRAELRSPADRTRRWWYVDNGSREVQSSAHDNTEVARWVLREHGIVLEGPDPGELLDPVPADRLRDEALATLDAWNDTVARTPDFPAGALAQQQHVLALCRVLCTLATAAVVSKDTAGRWALQALDPSWSDLIRTALDTRANPWERMHQQPSPGLARRTREFGELAVGHARGVDSAARHYAATEPLVIADVRRLISRGERDRLVVDDLRRDDLDRIPWSGGPRHPRDVGDALGRRDRGEVDYLAVRAPNGWPMSIGGVDYLPHPGAGSLWQLGTHVELRSLGLGARLITEAENRIRQRGLTIAVIGVEDDNDRAHALYARLGFADFDHEQAAWDEVDAEGTSRVHHAEVTLMRKRLEPAHQPAGSGRPSS